ncbi:tetratricopeptide repeat protein [Actinoplanes sp. TBRC 11911]|uniref:tetratricopeptide repeat protein n=1 Tax=Actinoplanes sp. TBRC 11911 TaxID=2729386 RepID=UPI00145DF250|nr:tetratricopeptide repeat protein [Actinoplanes sp. TBRC 11911]NMO51805.1 tetratricopeptide repeat protein [Actinoplanes sp. TBRC 11911]
MGFKAEVRAAFRRGESDAVVRMSEAEIERARAAGEPDGEVEAIYSLARVAVRNGDLAEAERLATEALDVALRTGDRALETQPRHVLAAVARMSGDLERARGLYRASMTLREQLGQYEAVNSELHNLAFTELHLGNLDEARTMFATGREQVFREGWDSFVPYLCVAGAALAAAEGDHARGALMVGVTDAAFYAVGQVPDPDDAAELAAVRVAAEKELGAERFAAEYARGRTLEPRAAFGLQ